MKAFIVLLLTIGLLTTCALNAQVALSADDDYTKTGTRYVVVWTASHKITVDRPNAFGQFPLFEFSKEYSLSFTTKAEASAFISQYNAAKASTGTLTTLGVPVIKIISTTDDK